jgi:hypothetical protein
MSCGQEFFSVTNPKVLVEITNEIEIRHQLNDSDVNDENDVSDITYFVKNRGTVFIILGEISKEYTIEKTIRRKDFIGFKGVIPEYNVNLPSFTIDKFPHIGGCEDPRGDDWPIPCGKLSIKKVKKCAKRAGIKVCVDLLIPYQEKRLGEIYFKPITVPETSFFKFPETVFEFKCQLLPTIEMKQKYTLSNLVSLYPNFGSTAKVVSFEVSKFVIGIEFYISSLNFTFGGKGVKLKNKKFTIIKPVDFFAGKTALTATATSTGKLQLKYLITTFSFSLYDLLIEMVDAAAAAILLSTAANIGAANLATGLIITELVTEEQKLLDPKYVDPNYIQGLIDKGNSFITKETPKIVLEFLKRTKIIIELSLLVCPGTAPDIPYFFSLVATASTSFKPFKNIKDVKIPKIPPTYKIPDIPDFKVPKFLPENYLNNVKDSLNKDADIINQNGAGAVARAAAFLKNYIENYTIAARFQLAIPIVPNPPAPAPTPA